jgi:hypothetical protein
MMDLYDNNNSLNTTLQLITVSVLPDRFLLLLVFELMNIGTTHTHTPIQLDR